MNTFTEIDVTELKEMMNSQRVGLIIDIRDMESFAKAHIPGALNIPLSQLPSQCEQIAKNKPIVCYCFRGNSSKLAAQHLVEQGFGPVYSLKGGFTAFAAA